MSVRLRFAPSPTGYLHVGGARTALYNYLYAKKRKGTFVLRVEDTDLERSTEESMRLQFGDLHWLGLNWDEGLNPQSFQDEGPYAPYRQSQRQEIYKEQALKLVQEGKAYHCFLTDEELEEQKKKAPKGAHIVSPYRDMDLVESQKRLEAGEKSAIRLKTPKSTKTYTFQDIVRGEVSFPSDMVGDFILIRSNGMPVYNFCCAVDDALMKITHVLRAEEHLNNTLRQLMICEALGFSPPQFGHLSIILGEDKQKLSKRHGATSCYEYRQKGFLPEAVINYLALLGWSSPEGQEILSPQELVDQFSLDRFNPASAVFDEKKMRWVNATHLRALSDEKLWPLIVPFLQKEGLEIPQDREWISASLELFKPYLETLVDAVELYRPMLQPQFQIAEESKEVLSWPESQKVFTKWKDLLESSSQETLSSEDFKQAQEQIKKDCGVKGKHLFMPLRTAIIGKPHGADVALLVPLMNKSLLIDRVKKVMES